MDKEYFVFPYRNKAYSFIDMFNRLVATIDTEILKTPFFYDFGNEIEFDDRRRHYYFDKQILCL